MRKRTKWIIGLLAAAAAVFALRMYLFGEGDDKDLIAKAVKESVQASKEGRPGGVMDYLSESFTVNDESMGSRREIAKFIRQARPDIEVRPFTPVIGSTGDFATIVTPVHVKASYLGFSFDQEIPNVTITLQKERATRWLVFPGWQWRVIGVKAPDIKIDAYR